MKSVKVVRMVLAIFFFLSICLISNTSFAEEKIKLNMKINSARVVLEEMEEMPDTSIPSDLLKACYGIAIFPSVIKGAFGFGGMGGSGVLLARDPDTGKWSPPVFVSIGGLSFGFQIGGQATDMILVIMSERGVMSLSHDNITLGGDASVAAGPLGRNAEIATDVALNTGIYSYSRSKGLFIGISLKGAIVGPQKNLVKDYYGEDMTAEKILFSKKVKATETGEKLIDLLDKYDY